MGVRSIKMPDVGEGVAEAEIVEWTVKVGDLVREDQVVAAVMTDKATVDIPTPVAGAVLALGGAVGDVLAVGAELIRIDAPGVPDSAVPAAPTSRRSARTSLPASQRRTSAITGSTHSPRSRRRSLALRLAQLVAGVASIVISPPSAGPRRPRSTHRPGRLPFAFRCGRSCERRRPG